MWFDINLTQLQDRYSPVPNAYPQVQGSWRQSCCPLSSGADTEVKGLCDTYLEL